MAKKSQRVKTERSLVKAINVFIAPHGCVVSGIGPSAVGVQGDARSYGLSVIIRFPKDHNHDQIMEISTLITNRVPQVTRVLSEVL